MKNINQTYIGGDVSSTKLSFEYFNFLPFLLNCGPDDWQFLKQNCWMLPPCEPGPCSGASWTMTAWNFFLSPAPSPQENAADSLSQTLIWLWWYLPHTTQYIQQQAGSLLCFSKGQQPALLNEKDLVPCGIVLINWSIVDCLRPFTLGCQNTLQALIILTSRIWSRSAASPLFNQQLACGTGRGNAAEGCEASEVLWQAVLCRYLYHHS